MVVVAGDDEDGGAASVMKGAAAAVVLGDGEEDGEVRRGLGVWMVASGLLRGVGVGEAKAVALLGLRRGWVSSGAGAPTCAGVKKRVKQMRVIAVIQLTKEGELGGATEDEMDDGVARLRPDANGDSKR